MKVEAVNALVSALYVKPASVAGASEPVADVPNATKVVVSAPASAKVTVPALPVIVVWSPVLAPETETAPAPIVRTEVLPELAVKVRVPVLTVRAVVRVAFVTAPAVNPEAVPVTLVIIPEAGVPKAGVTKVGEVAKTKAPEPVSLEIKSLSSREVVAAKTERLSPVVVKVPEEFGKVYVRSAVRSAVVIIPAKVAPPPVAGVSRIVSALASLLVKVNEPLVAASIVSALAKVSVPLTVSPVKVPKDVIFPWVAWVVAVSGAKPVMVATVSA